jgi:hypothetical protein
VYLLLLSALNKWGRNARDPGCCLSALGFGQFVWREELENNSKLSSQILEPGRVHEPD